MATFLFDKIIFGPVKSRRLGVSLGVNLLPVDTKVCSFNCIYCECGLTPKKYDTRANMPSREEVKNNLEIKLSEMQAEGALPDVITFAGNGEPTLHPDFAGIIGDTLLLRDKLAPKARIAVLSNASMIHKPDVFGALLKIDDNILKLDSAFEETVRLLDCPAAGFGLEQTVGQLCRFNGKVIIQTMFIRGEFKGQTIDNTTEEEIEAWLQVIGKIKPSLVMIYTIARDTPFDTLRKVPLEELKKIAARVKNTGLTVQVSG